MFHVSKLRRFYGSPENAQYADSEEFLDAKEELDKENQPMAMLEKRKRGSKIEVLVHWKGRPPEATCGKLWLFSARDREVGGKGSRQRAQYSGLFCCLFVKIPHTSRHRRHISRRETVEGPNTRSKVRERQLREEIEEGLLQEGSWFFSD